MRKENEIENKNIDIYSAESNEIEQRPNTDILFFGAKGIEANPIKNYNGFFISENNNKNIRIYSAESTKIDKKSNTDTLFLITKGIETNQIKKYHNFFISENIKIKNKSPLEQVYNVFELLKSKENIK